MILAFGIIGLLAISFAIWLKNERRQDIWFVAGGLCLLIYSIGIGSWIFIILQIVFTASALVEIFKLRKKGNGSQE